MTNSIDELEEAGCIFIIGSNTSENHPVIALGIRKAVKENGASLIVADPRKIGMTDFAQVWMRQTPGTDVALINGMMNVIIAEDLYDKAFVEERTEGFEEVKEVVAEYTPSHVEEITGVPAPDIEKAARMYARAERASIVYAMGITQHVSGTDNVKSLANLAMLTGNIGRESTGVNPLRGQNNVQGACDMGALPNVFPGYQPVGSEDVRKKFEDSWQTSLSGSPGSPLTESIHKANSGEVKAMYVLGEDPLLSDPNGSHVREGLEKLEFLVVQDIFLTETGKMADVVLPGISFAEKEGTFTNTERRVQRVRKAIEPKGDARADWQIICDLATRMGYPMSYGEPKNIMEEIASLTPSYGGISYDRLEKDGLQWPCPTRDHAGTRYLHKEQFTRGKGKFHRITFNYSPELPDSEYPFILTTGRVLYHFHTGNMSRRSYGLDTICPEGTVEINPEDAEQLNCQDGDMVEVSSRRGVVKVKVEVSEKSAPRVVFMTFHFKESAVNLLTLDKLDPVAKIPELKVCAVKISKAGESPSPVP
jgi:formate dehydrogenase alpha subunit